MVRGSRPRSSRFRVLPMCPLPEGDLPPQLYQGETVFDPKTGAPRCIPRRRPSSTWQPPNGWRAHRVLVYVTLLVTGLK